METRASPNPGSNTKQSAHMDALSLMHSRIPIKGNYREPEYEELVKKAASILYDSYFDRTTKNRQVTAYASCCKVWERKGSFETRTILSQVWKKPAHLNR